MPDPSSELSLSIAGFSLLVRSKNPHLALRFDDAIYAPFALGGSGQNDETFRVSVKLGSFPKTERLARAFRGSEAQTWYRDGNDFLIEWSRPGHDDQPYWLARFDGVTESVCVHCAEWAAREVGGGMEVDNPVSYPLDQMLMMTWMAKRSGALHHAAGGVAGDTCWLFPGRSGAGKSTITRWLVEAGALEMLSDDRMITRRIDGAYRAYGTPWPGEAGIARNESAPLGGFLFLHKAKENRVEELTPAHTVERLLPVTSIPWFEPSLFDPILDYLDELARAVPAFDLHFRNDASSAAFVADFLRAGG